MKYSFYRPHSGRCQTNHRKYCPNTGTESPKDGTIDPTKDRLSSLNCVTLMRRAYLAPTRTAFSRQFALIQTHFTRRPEFAHARSNPLCVSWCLFDLFGTPNGSFKIYAKMEHFLRTGIPIRCQHCRLAKMKSMSGQIEPASTI